MTSRSIPTPDLPAALPAQSAVTDPVGLTWLVTVRWTTVAAGAGAVVAGDSALDLGVPPVAAILIGAITLSNLWLMWQVGRGAARSRRTAGLLICGDTIALFGILSQTGGALNPASIDYLVQIVVAALVLGRAWTGAVTALSVSGYALLFLIQTDDLRLAQSMHPEFALHMRGMWLAFACTALVIGVLVARLATAVERRDRALEQLRDQADRSARLAGLATVVAGAAHELNTPLATMAVAATELERALADLEGSGELQEDARLIRNEIDRCRHLLQGMAGRFAAPQGEAPRPTRLEAVVGEAIASLAPPDRARVVVELRADGSVVWPAAVVAQALGNLLRNALQASSEAPVRLEAGAAGDDHVRILVIDRGRGMAADELAQAGQPFFTTKQPGGGIGLGLFVVRASVEALGGTLSLVSSAGGGTTATIVLPRDSIGGRP